MLKPNSSATIVNRTVSRLLAAVAGAFVMPDLQVSWFLSRNIMLAGAASRLFGRYRGARCARRNAAIDEHSLAREVRARVRGQEDHGAVQILRGARPPHRDAVDDVFQPLFVLVEDGVLRGLEPAGRKAVDGD